MAVRYKNNLGYTPLHLAAKLGHLRVARELLMAGARADLKDQVRPVSPVVQVYIIAMPSHTTLLRETSSFR